MQGVLLAHITWMFCLQADVSFKRATGEGSIGNLRLLFVRQHYAFFVLSCNGIQVPAHWLTWQSYHQLYRQSGSACMQTRS